MHSVDRHTGIWSHSRFILRLSGGQTLLIAHNMEEKPWPSANSKITAGE
ncbi:MAG: DUF3465 domain-containing protein [Desulfosarcina sp.]|nr:DUF3465 domain-containing protein [Desulfosarcina sp.]